MSSTTAQQVLTTFHNDPLQKQKYVSIYEKGEKDNLLIRGNYFCEDTQQGCLVGLPTRSSSHAQLAEESGNPEWIIRVGETIYEGMPEETYKSFPRKLFEAIPVGITHERLNIVKHKLFKFNLEEICQGTDHETVKEPIREIISLHQRVIDNKPVSYDEWISAARSAYSAVYSAADLAVRSAARSAADSAARSARSAAYSAAYSAVYSARSATRSACSATRSACSAADSADSARSAACQKMGDKLIELLKELEVEN